MWNIALIFHTVCRIRADVYFIGNVPDPSITFSSLRLYISLLVSILFAWFHPNAVVYNTSMGGDESADIQVHQFAPSF